MIYTSSGASSPAKEKGHHLSLKRFLKKLKPTDSRSSVSSTKSKTQAPPLLPENSSSELFKKYGSIGRLLGSGASGSVNLVTSKTDPTQIYAVKKFRAKLPGEQESDYKSKVKNEFKIGALLKHENLINTVELINDAPKDTHSSSSRFSSKRKTPKVPVEPEYYIVMEYCPFDFFNLVMSGLMDNSEIFCYFRQIVSGVAFLHENGLAHRDLKLDNCVVSQNGILKLIDFGSAVQFRKEVTYTPAETDIILDDHFILNRARGIVGSDPYLSPEVFETGGPGYDPRAADVWSIAVMFCCMILKRFPWKIPKLSDPSYRSFVGVPNHNHEEALQHSMSELSVNGSIRSQKSNTPHGPDRLLRLLPEHSRHLLKKMLHLEPSERILMPEILEDHWLNSIEQCHMVVDEDNGHQMFVQAFNHTHHLVTEEELQRLNQEKERVKKLKASGVA
ncbi:protein kinase [Scheffersomyces xylosifermentans]|uniref:protein kinase n=1 Tax=Scheffersomyces xylosifermentans TaxID=1304137 RepID=UPI00315DB628